MVPCAAQGVGMGPGGPGTPSQNTTTSSSLPGVGVTPPPLGGPPLAHIPPGAGPPQFRALIPPFVSLMFPVIVKSRNFCADSYHSLVKCRTLQFGI